MIAISPGGPAVRIRFAPAESQAKSLARQCLRGGDDASRRPDCSSGDGREQTPARTKAIPYRRQRALLLPVSGGREKTNAEVTEPAASTARRRQRRERS